MKHKNTVLILFVIVALAGLLWAVYQDGYKAGFLDCTYHATGIKLN